MSRSPPERPHLSDRMSASSYRSMSGYEYDQDSDYTRSHPLNSLPDPIPPDYLIDREPSLRPDQEGDSEFEDEDVHMHDEKRNEDRYSLAYSLDPARLHRSPSYGSLAGPSEPPAKRKKASPTKGSVKSEPKAYTPGSGPKRAAQACLRCRRQKLRCLGGYPCDRCARSKNDCEYGRPGVENPTSGYGSMSSHTLAKADKGESGGRKRSTSKKESEHGRDLSTGHETEAEGEASNVRLAQLESSVANLLAGLAGGPSSYPQNEVLHQLGDNHMRRQSTSSARQRKESSSSWAPVLPPPTHSRPLEAPRFGPNPLQPSLSPDEHGRGYQAGHVRFNSSPGHILNPSPSTYASSGFGQTPEDVKDGKKREEPEQNIAAATESLYEAPFKGLLHQNGGKGMGSRRNSVGGSMPPSRDEPMPGNYQKRFGRERDDPVNAGLVSLAMAETLFQFFVDHCHPFLPIVNVALDDAFTTIRQSPPLISAMLAIAARFYIRYTSRTSTLARSLPTRVPLPLNMDSNTPAELANLAESHLGHSLLRKQFALSDVQAILLLAAWGMHSGGRGPDAWIVTGHAARVSRRLGVHKVLAQAAETARCTEPGSEEWEKLETFMPQWRTWLCWFAFDGFLSLGFGRPQSTQFETVDESGFLQIRLNQPLPRPGSTSSISLHGDVYIAGQVQLAQIGRDLINWGEMVADPEKAIFADPRRAETFKGTDLSLSNMFRELNSRLDDWSRSWVWTGSPYALYLGSSARIARLQAEHMRLCLNSYALKAGPDEDELVAHCLKKALNAAMSTIQTHYESSQTDLALSFATDYLTITLAQAAVFLIRMTKAPESAQAVVGVEHSVVAHYLRMSVDLLETADLSETRLSTYLAKTIKDLSRAAGITNIGNPPASTPATTAHIATNNDNLPVVKDTDISLFDPTLGFAEDGSNGNATAFDLDAFFQMDNELDLSYLLGLPGDNGNTGMQGGLNYGSGGFTGEFGFGMGGISVGPTPNMNLSMGMGFMNDQ